MKSDVQLNLRAKESQRALIDAAAEILHKSRTDFILGLTLSMARRQQLASPMSEFLGISAVGVILVFGGSLVRLPAPIVGAGTHLPF